MRGLIRMLCLTVGTRTLHAALTPLDVQGQRLALLLLGNDASCGPIELQLFAQLNGLTAAEARVLAGLNRGRRPAQIAREHEVALTTVQSQISAVRAKTQSASIFSLVARLARLPAIKAALDSGSSDAA